MKKIFLLATGLLFGVFSFAGNSEILPKPDNEKLVVDDAGFLDASVSNSLEQELEDFSSKTSTQIAVVTVKTLNGYDIDDYAVRLLTQWGLGQKGKDNGILVLIKPKTADKKGEVAISVGYGLEGVVPDAVAKRIVENEIIPAFKKGQYGQGIEKAVKVLMELTKGEYTADSYMKKTQKSNWGSIFAIIIFGLIWLLPIFSRKRGHTVGGGGVSSALFWGLGAGSFGDFSSGSGGFGGGGGFGGFGGGMGGGGGASGSW